MEALAMPGALRLRLSERIRSVFFVQLADGDAGALGTVRSLRWYDALELRIYKLETYRKVNRK